MLSALASVLVFIAAIFVTLGLLWAFVAFLGFLIQLISLPFSLTGLIVSVIQQKRGMGENGKTIATRSLIVGVIGAIAVGLAAFCFGAAPAHIIIAALVGLFLGAIFGL